MSLLMAGGNAVCGSSAIASIAPAIQADEEEKRPNHYFSKLIRNRFNVDLTHFKWDSLWYQFVGCSALIGGTLQSVGQVVASANMVNENAVQLAMLFKIMRIVLLVAVVYLFGRFKQSKTAESEAELVEVTKKQRPTLVCSWLFHCLCL